MKKKNKKRRRKKEKTHMQKSISSVFHVLMQINQKFCGVLLFLMSGWAEVEAFEFGDEEFFYFRF
jgi:hypothetical protein